MILKECTMCKKLVRYPNRYCKECYTIAENIQQEYKQQRNKIYDKKRNPIYKKFYDSCDWKNLKNRYLSDVRYECEECKKLKTENNIYTVKIAEEVHHIEAIQTEEGWYKRLDYNNLKALCHIHHNIYHKRFLTKA